jgi:hypothetical protein
LDFSSSALSCIEQPANRCHQDKYQNNGMKLEEKEKQKRSSYQKKYGD